MGFKDGDVVSYTPSSTWCHHGLAVVHVDGERVFSHDTYWGLEISSLPSYWADVTPYLSEENIVGNIHEFDTKWAWGWEYEDFADKDKFYIPIGGGSASKWVRKGAEPVLTAVRDRLYYRIEKARDDIESAKWRKERAVTEYQKFMDEHPEVPLRGPDAASD